MFYDIGSQGPPSRPCKSSPVSDYKGGRRHNQGSCLATYILDMFWDQVVRIIL